MSKKENNLLLPEDQQFPEKIEPETGEEEEEDEALEEYQFVCDHISYGIADAVFSACIVAPLVVSVWRGTWNLMEMQAPFFPYVQSFVLGILVHLSFAFVRNHLLQRSVKGFAKKTSWCWLKERFISRLYTYMFILSNIMHWRGGFGLFDAAVVAILPDDTDPHRPVLLAAMTIVPYLCNITFRSSRNILASPYFLITDGKEPTYFFTTRFKTKVLNSRETALYVLDCVFSVGVVGSLVVFVWRGSWALLDFFLYPEDAAKSGWCSLTIGYALVVVTFSLQAPVRWAAARLHGAPRLLLADVYHLLSFLATVNVWRGVWGLLDVYLFPKSPKLSNWCCHIISLTLLILLNCSNSVLVRGVYIDAEEPAGECVVFPCHYLRLYFHKERTKKRHKALTAAAKKPEDSSVPLQIPEEKV